MRVDYFYIGSVIMSDEIDTVSRVEMNSVVELSKHPEGIFVELLVFNQHVISAVAMKDTSPV